MSLQTHTFFLDTTHATPQGHGSWQFQFQDPIEVRNNQIVHVGDITFRKSFPTVDVFSNKLYLLTKYDDANFTKPDLSSTWTEHEGGSTASISVSKLSDTEFQYIDGAQAVRWTITKYDNPSQIFTIN